MRTFYVGTVALFVVLFTLGHTVHAQLTHNDSLVVRPASIQFAVGGNLSTVANTGFMSGVVAEMAIERSALQLNINFQPGANALNDQYRRGRNTSFMWRIYLGQPAKRWNMFVHFGMLTLRREKNVQWNHYAIPTPTKYADVRRIEDKINSFSVGMGCSWNITRHWRLHFLWSAGLMSTRTTHYYDVSNYTVYIVTEEPARHISRMALQCVRYF